MDLFVTVFAVTMGLYIGSFILLMRLKKEKEAKRSNSKAFYRVLKSGLKANTINSLSDVVNLYRGVSGESLEDLSYHRDLGILLRKFLVDLVSRKFVNGKDDSDLNIDFNDDELISDWKSRIDTYINQIDEISPYADLPDAERNLLNDISSSIDADEVKRINSKLLELAGLIKSKNNDLIYSKRVNRWTVPLTVIGVILTLFFGVIALYK